MSMSFEKAMQEYLRLKANYQAGALGMNEFESAVARLQIQDANGVSWQIGVESGKWYRLSNGEWLESVPPQSNKGYSSAGAIPASYANQVASTTPEKPSGAKTGCIIAGVAGVILALILICVGVLIFWNASRGANPPAVSIPDYGITPGSKIIETQPAIITEPTNIQPTTAPLIPTTAPSNEAHSQELSPEPYIYNFITCTAPCSENPDSQQSTFPEGTTKLYLRYSYDWIAPGSDYVRLWKNGGQEWVRYQCKWDGPESGVFETDIREPAGFRSGEWTMEIYVNGQLVTQNSFTVQGNYTYWDPAGTINRCK